MGTINVAMVAAKSALGVLLALFALPGYASVIYDGGAPDQGGQIYSEAPAAVAMNFTLASGSNVVTGANWWGGCYPSVTCGSAPAFQISFYTDSSGAPGTLLDTFNVGSAGQTATGALIGSGWDEYAYDASFAPLTLASATQYWFSISETAAEPSGTWGTETTSTAPPGSLMDTIGIFSPTAWTTAPENLAFELTNQPGSVPEPATLVLIGLGLAGLNLVRRRHESV